MKDREDLRNMIIISLYSFTLTTWLDYYVGTSDGTYIIEIKTKSFYSIKSLESL